MRSKRLIRWQLLILDTGEVGTAWAGGTGSGTATAADDGAGREAEEGETGLCHGQPG